MNAVKNQIETIVEDFTGTRHVIVATSRAPSDPRGTRVRRPHAARHSPAILPFVLTGYCLPPVFTPAFARPGFGAIAAMTAHPQDNRPDHHVKMTDAILSKWAHGYHRSFKLKQRVFELILVAAILTFFL